MQLRQIFIRAAVIVLGLTPILEAQEFIASRQGPVICPPLVDFKLIATPTLLDIFIRPGFTMGS